MNEWNPNEALLPEGWEEGKDLFAPEEEKAAPEEEKTAPEEEIPPERDYAGEVALLRRVWPDLKEMPEEVARRAAEGENIVAAYALWESRERLKESEALRRENALLRKAASAAARAPVKGAKGAVKQKMSDFERGMDLM